MRQWSACNTVALLSVQALVQFHMCALPVLSSSIRERLWEIVLSIFIPARFWQMVGIVRRQRINAPMHAGPGLLLSLVEAIPRACEVLAK